MSTTIEGAGVELAVERHGAEDGTPVVIVHGLASDAQAWGPDARALAADGAYAVTYDRRGYGASGAPEAYAATTVAEQTADLVAVLDALDLEDAVVAGDGFGALVALDAALRFGDRVRGLVAANPPLFAFVPDAAQELAQQRALLEDALREGGPAAGVAAWLGGRVRADALERAQASAPAFFADYAGLASLAVTRAELRALAVPTVVLTGRFAPPHVLAAADALAGFVPGARRTVDADLPAGVRAVIA